MGLQAKYPSFNFFNALLLDVTEEDLRAAFKGDVADFSFCIEVAEHVEPRDRLPFLQRLREFTRVSLFLSTPNKVTRPTDGALTTDQWRELLSDAGFTDVVTIEWQWTTLFISS